MSSNFLNFLIVWKPSEQDQATKKMSYIALLIKKESKQREHALKHHHHHSLRVLVYKIIQKIRLNKANPRRNCYVCMEQLQCILLHHYVLNSLLSTAPTLVKSFSLM